MKTKIAVRLLQVLILLVSGSSWAQPQPQAKLSQASLAVALQNSNAAIRFSAHWLSDNVLALPANIHAKQLVLATITEQPVTIGQSTILTQTTMPQAVAQQFPHLASFNAYSLHLTKAEIKQWLKHRVMLLALDEHQQISQAIEVQLAGVIDQLYTSSAQDADEIADFGAKIVSNGVQFKLWAPTAQAVQLLRFDATQQLIDSVPLREDTRTGAWQVIHPQAKNGDYYQYQLSLYHPARQKMETLLVTDPYALSLSTNSSFSQVIDLNALATQPDGWLAQANIALAAPEEHILYELHIRDFSASDHTLADNSNRGKYAAFSEPNSAGINHLKQLQRSGINTIHLLPTFDIGTINEEPAQAIDLQDPLSKVCQQVPELTLCHNTNLSSRLIEVLNQLPTDSAQTQAIISAIRAQDNYNWGYDPLHFTVPEGSYAKNPQGFARIKEFRQMILSLHRLGFRVVMDVVYNHTNAAGLAHNSVLDKIVPNYYHRLHPLSGAIEQSTCCDNTATERQMMAKLMTDSLLVWARDYKIDGFRFDLMGHQPKSLMLAAREAVRQVDPDSYFYGEGWNFGEVANNQRFTQASQLNLAGTEIGTFSDRLRDAVRGPGIGVSGVAIRASQGIGNGLLTLPNEQPQLQSTREQYLHLMDQLRIGLAGNLANFPLLNHAGVWLQGKDIPYADQPTGYAFDPADTINYVSKHDNQTLWDNNQYRNAFELSTEQRVRLHLQSLAYPLFAQGIPFLQMGAELLRSKSFLRDSYDYGDWFNRVDFTMQHNNYQVGLPPAEKDQENWPLIQSVLAGNQGRDRVNTEQIAFTNAVFNELVQIRRSSPLFRLRTNQQILNSVKFLNTGPQQQTGLILMLLDDSHGSVPVDHQWQQVLVLFNANNSEQTFHYADADKFNLHPLQQHSVDAKVSNSRATATKFVVPALTTSVFVRPRTTPKP